MSCKKFLFYFILSMSLCGLMIFFILCFLAGLYEHKSYVEIVQRQITRNSLYGTRFNNFPESYFLELVKQRKPEILMVGSSRSGLFKEKYFKASFVTTPKASDTFPQMEKFLDGILDFYTPKIVFIEFDPWLLLEKPRGDSAHASKFNGNEMAVSLQKIYGAIKLLLTRQIMAKQLFDDNTTVNPYTDYDSLGVLAINRSNGYLKDGSYFHGYTYFGLALEYDKKFQKSLWKIENRQGAFLWSQTYNQENILFFKKLVEKLKKRGIKVVSIIMPIAPYIYLKTYKANPERYAYWQELESNARKFEIYDFLNPADIKTNDCEFIDGIHPGDIVSARVLKEIGRRDESVRKYLNMKEIDWAINNRAGHVYSGKDFGKYKEVDFLGLGCKKH